MKAMSVKEFDSLSSRDFDNGAVLDEIREALEEHETQKKQLAAVAALFQEMKQQEEKKLRVSRDKLSQILKESMEIMQDTDGWQDAINYAIERMKEYGVEVE